MVIVAVVGLYALELQLASPNGSTNPTSVTVSGSAVTVEPGAGALNLLFTNESGKIFNATITNGRYSIVLPTNHTYSVQFRFQEAPSLLQGYVGFCGEGNLSVPATPGSSSLRRDWSC
jgi:hypothetical protein